MQEHNAQQAIQQNNAKDIMQNNNNVDRVIQPNNIDEDKFENNHEDLFINRQNNAPQNHIVKEQILTEYDSFHPISFHSIKTADKGFIVIRPSHIRRTADIGIPLKVYQQQALLVEPPVQYTDHIQDEVEAMVTNNEEELDRIPEADMYGHKVDDARWTTCHVAFQ